MSTTNVFIEFVECLKVNTFVWFIVHASIFAFYRWIFAPYYYARKFNPNYTPYSLLIKEIAHSWSSVVVCTVFETILYYFNCVDYHGTFTWNDLFMIMQNESIGNSLYAMYKYGFCFQNLIIALLEDMEFYFYHRLCHENHWLWQHVHKIHHQSYNPNVWSGISMHWIESAMYFFPMFMFIYFDTPSIVFSFFKFGLILGPIPNHVGYGNKKEHKLNWCIAIFFKGSYYHYIHHATSKYNFGSGVTPIWDKLMGTEYKIPPNEHFDKIEKIKKRTK